ncbi:MAG: hypothetical protein GF393_04900 [Armatimonadia bacterium]|nr:hypothetical protein [Armatimonadia bacterium]
MSQLPRALVHPLPIVFAAATIAAGVLMPLLALPGAAAWAISLGAIARRRVARSARPDTSHLPPSIQAELLDVTVALDQLQGAARSVPASQRPMFDGIEREADEVRDSVRQLAVQAGTLHRRIEAEVREGGSREADAQRRERLLARLERYRGTLRSLEESATDLADRALDLATEAPMGYDALDEQSPERKISEMKASVAAIEEVMRADTETL